jgi:nucleoside-diphosphate-sugar epimerase
VKILVTCATGFMGSYLRPYLESLGHEVIKVNSKHLIISLPVAIVGDKVVASGTNAKEVLEEAKRKYPNKLPALAKIPKEDTVIYELS